MQAEPAHRYPESRSLDELASGLYGFLSRTYKPRPTDGKWRSMVIGLCEEIRGRAARAREEAAESQGTLRALLDEVVEKLRDYADAVSGRASSARLKRAGRSLSTTYEGILLHIKVHAPQGRVAGLPHFKPRNLYRNAFHAGVATAAVLLYELLLTRGQALFILLAIFAVIGGLEVARRFSGRLNHVLVNRVFAPISRPKEHFKVNSSTWYLAAMILMTASTPRPALCLGLLALGYGDPTASLAGKRWGKKKLLGDKSLAGTLGFFAAAFSVGLIYLRLFHPELSPA
ncbi:MAG: hypothetical protein JRI97_04590, partial [Deltaproteobacteria bacterium]|nr:hypothetical protein [Deltaproteobacteria bacterium]